METHSKRTTEENNLTDMQLIDDLADMGLTLDRYKQVTDAEDYVKTLNDSPTP